LRGGDQKRPHLTFKRVGDGGSPCVRARRAFPLWVWVMEVWFRFGVEGRFEIGKGRERGDGSGGKLVCLFSLLHPGYGEGKPAPGPPTLSLCRRCSW
jgi:hypothetical protein